MLDRWSTSFPGCEPVAHELQAAFAHRWVRFHSLPGSKRYPDSETEYELVLDRHNAVITALTPAGAPLVVLTTVFSDVSAPSEPPRDDWPASTWWRAVQVDDAFWHVYAAQTRWEPHRFDTLLRRVADDSTGNVMICPPGCDWLIHPYDGGMDVFLDSAKSRDGLRERFRDWLSPRADGF